MDSNFINNVGEADTDTAALILAITDTTERAARQSAQIQRIDAEAKPFRTMPDGTIISMEGFQTYPSMRRAEVQVHTSASFGEYVNRFKEPEDTVIFGDQLALAFTAILDYHQPGVDGVARWGRHRVTLKLQPTPEWTEWLSKDRQPMTQADFSTWIEDRIPDILRPDGADLVTMTRTMEAKKDAQYKSHIRMDNGAHQFLYTETIQGTVKDGALAVPAEFTLLLIPFMGAEPREVTARFRYRLAGGALSLWYELVRPSDIVQAAFNEEYGQIESIEGITMLAGTAPAAVRAE